MPGELMAAPSVTTSRSGLVETTEKASYRRT
jgi:hypothetical protein